MEGGNILHHVKWRGIVREGEMSGDMSGGICPGGRSGFREADGFFTKNINLGACDRGVRYQEGISVLPSGN